MKSIQCTPTHQGFSKCIKAWKEALWFGRSKHYKQNKQLSFVHKYSTFFINFVMLIS